MERGLTGNKDMLKRKEKPLNGKADESWWIAFSVALSPTNHPKKTNSFCLGPLFFLSSFPFPFRYGGWKTVKHFFQKLELKKDISILHVGCGNSAIAEEMHDYGYRHSYCIDFVDNVIAEMKKRSQESCPEIKYDVMDITDSAFVSHVDSNFRFQVVLDKVSLLPTFFFQNSSSPCCCCVHFH